LFAWYAWGISFVFSLIMVIMLYSLFVFRRRKGETGDGTPIPSNSKLEIAWTVLPLLVVFYLAFVGAQSLSDTRRIDPSAMQVKVITGQWYWQFQYPEAGVASNELYLVVDRQVNLQMTSVDVIHSFWVPEFRLKQDIVPGRTIEMRVTPTVLGDYKVRCAQLCGRNHAYMEADVHVVTQEAFDAWVAEQIATAGQDPVLHGQQLVQQFGCAVCHSVDGTKRTGPTWLHLAGSEVTLVDGTTVTADGQYLQDAILDPNLQIVAGYVENVMPATFSQIMDDDQVKAIIAYIQSLK
jgi:cytochrome c oxidase subunit 2